MTDQTIGCALAGAAWVDTWEPPLLPELPELPDALLGESPPDLSPVWVKEGTVTEDGSLDEDWDTVGVAVLVAVAAVDAMLESEESL